MIKLKKLKTDQIDDTTKQLVIQYLQNTEKTEVDSDTLRDDLKIDISDGAIEQIVKDQGLKYKIDHPVSLNKPVDDNDDEAEHIIDK